MEKTSSRFTPKYWQLVEQFRQQIEVGLLKPGDRLPSYVEMRKNHGASRPTTERIHAVLEKEGLIMREAGRGIFVAEPRRQERRAVIGFGGSAFIIGDNPYAARIVQGVHETADKANVEILLFNKTSKVEWEKVDGVVICEMSPDPWVARLPPGMPSVVLLVDYNETSNVIADDKHGAYEATRHLISLGHRRIGYLCSSIGTPEEPVYHALSVERIQGYKEALAEAGIEVEAGWLRPMALRYFKQKVIERGREGMEQWLEDGFKELGLTAILCQNDDAALGVIPILQEAGYSVPEDMSIVGFDGTELAEYCTPSLTTVEVPLREMSVRGTEILLRQIDQNLENSQAARIEKVILPPRLVVRESTAPPRG